MSWYALTVGALTALALLVRVVALGHQPLGGDESFTAVVSRRSWLDMFAAVRSDSGAPLAYVLTHLMTSVSSDAGMLRLPSALAGTAVVPLAAALARRVGGNAAGAWAALTAAIVPALVLPARDARMYALAGALVLAMSLTLWRAVEHPSRGRLLVHALVVGAAVLTDYFALAAVVASLIATAVSLQASRPVLVRVGAATVAGGAALLLWVPFAGAQFHHLQQPFWLDGIGFAGALGGVFSQFLGGPTVDPHLAQQAALESLRGVAIAGAAVVVLALLFARERTQPGALGYVAGCGLGAALVIGLINIVHPVLDARYVSVVWTPLFALLGVGLARMRWAGLLPIACMAAATAAMSVVTTRADVSDLVRGQLDGRVGTGTLVLATTDTYMQVLASADGAVATRTHVEAPRPPWYFGVAAYPPGAVISSLPPGTRSVDVITQPANRTPSLVDNAVMVERTCTTLACLTVYAVR